MSSPTPQVSTGETARAAAPKPCMLRHAPSNLTFAPTTASFAPPRRHRDAHGLCQHLDDLKIPQLDALAIALGMDKPPAGKKEVKAAIVRPLFDAHAEQKADED